MRDRLKIGQKRQRAFIRIESIMLDADEFKSIHDIHGHTIGDQALVHTAAILKKAPVKTAF